MNEIIKFIEELTDAVNDASNFVRKITIVIGIVTILLFIVFIVKKIIT